MDVIALGALERPTDVAAKKPRSGSRNPFQAAKGTVADLVSDEQSLKGAVKKPREEAYRLILILAFVDGLVAAGGILLGLTLRSLQRGTGFWLAGELVHGGVQAEAWVFGGAILYVWLMGFFRAYEVENLYRLQFWAKNTLKAGALWVLICLATIALFQVSKYTPRVGLVVAATCIIALESIWRLLAFAILIQPSVRFSASARLICVGWNGMAEHLRQAVRNDVSQLCEIIGCVPGPDAKLGSRPPAEVSILGSYAQIPKLIRDCKATGIVLADTSIKSADIQRLVVFCQRQSLDFKMIPAYFPALSSGLEIRTLNGVPLLGVTQLPLDKSLNRLAKRLVDIVGALVGLVVSMPVVLFFALLVFIESPGWVFFRQVRMSRSGRTFYIYKIRSMRPNAEAASGAVWAKRDDPRRLRVGSFMRRWNIDELPQFLNVLTGEMSLVGPRPERPELVDRFKDTVLNYNARHEVKSGLTGWAQVHGYRGDTDLKKRIEHDLYYLENWSLFLDAYIMGGTVFRYRNAY
jgi:exopolysaccharide biosynthesis polyprenyl glycosylphosphotransferase